MFMDARLEQQSNLQNDLALGQRLAGWLAMFARNREAAASTEIGALPIRDGVFERRDARKAIHESWRLDLGVNLEGRPSHAAISLRTSSEPHQSTLSIP
jgi:hypothetical protein